MRLLTSAYEMPNEMAPIPLNLYGEAVPDVHEIARSYDIFGHYPAHQPWKGFAES